MTYQEIDGVRPAFVFAKAQGPYGWLTPYIAAIAAVDEDFSTRILVLPREERHFIALIITLMGDKAGDRDHVTAFARSYHRLSRRTLFESFAGPHGPAGILNLLPKLVGDVWSPARYTMLAEIFSDDQARKTLRHLKKLKRSHVKRLSELPMGFRSYAVLKKITKKRDLDETKFAIEAVRRIRTDLTDQAILKSLEGSRDNGIHDWVMKHYIAAPFPDAPIGTLDVAGGGTLMPLKDYKALQHAAREFSNCIRTYLYRVLRGDSFFYRYGVPVNADKATEASRDHGVAIVELRRAPVIGWVVHEAFGKGNKSIRRKQRVAILDAFTKAGIGAAPQAINPDAWFELN